MLHSSKAATSAELGEEEPEEEGRWRLRSDIIATLIESDRCQRLRARQTSLLVELKKKKKLMALVFDWIIATGSWP
jgi:hypothetical protein